MEPASGRRLALARIISMERALHPGMAIQDLSKLLHQAELGADHLLGTPRPMAEEHLAREWNALPPSADWCEPPLQLINPSAPVARLHLAPLKALGVPLDVVVEAVLGQSPRNGSLERLGRLVEEAAELAEEGLVGFDPAEVRSLEIGPAPPHHSRSYGPASYRVVNDAQALPRLPSAKRF